MPIVEHAGRAIKGAQNALQEEPRTEWRVFE